MADPIAAPAATPPEWRECADLCLLCYRTCLRTVFEVCLEAGGKHAAPAHVGLMLGCANICRTSAEFMLMQVKLHAKVCAACADVCQACAVSCDQIGGMEECVEVCRRCADACRRMAAGMGL